MGHPFCFGCPKENKDNSRSLRDDNKKGNSKSNGKGNRRAFDFAQDDGFRSWDRYGTATENSRFLRCAAHDETVSSFGRNDANNKDNRRSDLFRVGALRGAELGASILLLRPW